MIAASWGPARREAVASDRRGFSPIPSRRDPLLIHFVECQSSAVGKQLGKFIFCACDFKGFSLISYKTFVLFWHPILLLIVWRLNFTSPTKAPPAESVRSSPPCWALWMAGVRNPRNARAEPVLRTPIRLAAFILPVRLIRTAQGVTPATAFAACRDSRRVSYGLGCGLCVPNRLSPALFIFCCTATLVSRPLIAKRDRNCRLRLKAGQAWPSRADAC